MFEFKLPDLGEGIHEGELLKWHVKEGDSVKEDDPLCDMETDKAAVTIPSPRTGTIVSLGASPGDTVPVNGVLVIINDIKSGKDRSEPETASGSEISCSKRRVVAAPATRRLAREMGIDINTLMGSGPGGRVTREDLRAQAPETSSVSPRGSQSSLSPSPGYENTVEGLPEQNLGSIPFLKIEPMPDFAAQGPVERHPIRSLRKKTAVKTVSASLVIPHVAHMDEIDVTDLENLRDTYNRRQGDTGKLTLLSFVIRALPSLLNAYPEFNASVDTDQMEIVFKRYYNIGFAADTPRGLMVPVIKDADKQSLVGLSHRIGYLAQKGQEGSIAVAEMTGGTFTVTNVGAIGGTHVFPIINTPESAILGMGRVEKKAVVKENDAKADGAKEDGTKEDGIRTDVVVIRKVLPVTLCFDHRVADGAGAARFVRDLKKMLEDPLTFMARI
jgi:pyruvate dehydrogenase E2 component (dihydrolipoamide acetyltransferase)